MQQKKRSVTARIPEELYDKCNQQYENMTDAVIAGLELLCNTTCKTNVISNDRLIEEKDKTIKDLQNSNETLNKELENLKNNSPQIQFLLESHQSRIVDLKEQINSLHVQLKTKDGQIEKLNETIQGQVANIYNLSKENTKLLPENIKKNKSWWKFW